MKKFLDTLSRAVLSTKFLGMVAAASALYGQGLYVEMGQLVMAWLAAQGISEHGKGMGKPPGVGHKD